MWAKWIYGYILWDELISKNHVGKVNLLTFINIFHYHSSENN